MPELPEVQTIIDTLRPKLVGARFARVQLLRHDILQPHRFDFSRHLSGRKVSSIVRRGKRIVITLDDDNRFYIHLGMTGRLTLEPTASPAERHTHLICGIHQTRLELRFRDPRRFGGIFWLGKSRDDDSIGPEPLQLRASQLAKRLSRTNRAIKNVLLDQTVIAGIGNIYADEALFEARIHPLTRANQLHIDQIQKLNHAIKLTLRRAIKHRGSTLRDYVDADGATGRFQNLHRVYGRETQPCPICHTPIERIVLTGRSAHFCPRCQR